MTSTTESTVHNQNCNNDQQNQNDPSSPLINLIDSINLTNLSEYYDNKTDILFKKRIDKLNVKFYLETEKCMDSKTHEEIEKSHNKLFLILFKQISLYIEEIERLNKYIMSHPVSTSASSQSKSDDSGIKNKDNFISQNIISNLKNQNRNLEKRLNDKICSEEKKIIEIQSLKRQIIFYKEKLKLDLNHSTINNSINSSLNKKIASPIKSPIKRDTSHSPVNGHQFKKSYIHPKGNINNYDSKKNLICLSKSIEHKESRSVSTNAQSFIKNNNEALTLINYYENEIEDLSNLEKFLKEQKKEIEGGNVTIENPEKIDIFTKMMKKSYIADKKGNTNNIIFNKNGRDKSTTKKKNFPLMGSIKIDL